MTMRLSLHTWTLDTTPLPEALAVIKKTGWDAVELRRLDFERAAQAGQSAEQVLTLVRASGLPVRAAQRAGPDARGDGAGRPSPDWALARHVPPRAHRRLAARDRGRAAGGDRLRAVQRRAAHRPRAGQGARPPAAGAGERAVQGVLRRVRPAGLHRLRELR